MGLSEATAIPDSGSHAYVPHVRLPPRQALEYPLGQNGAAADTQTSESERVDAMIVQHFESLVVDDTTLAITGLQPDLTNSEDGSNIQAAIREENRRPWSTYVSAGLLVYFVCVLVLWQERCENMRYGISNNMKSGTMREKSCDVPFLRFMF